VEGAATLPHQLGVLGNAVSYPSGVCGGARGENEFDASWLKILASVD